MSRLSPDVLAWAVFSQLTKPAPYTCPFCDAMLLEGEQIVTYADSASERTRIAHLQCPSRWEPTLIDGDGNQPGQLALRASLTVIEGGRA